MFSVLFAWGVTVRPCSNLLQVDYRLSGACSKSVTKACEYTICCKFEVGYVSCMPRQNDISPSLASPSAYSMFQSSSCHVLAAYAAGAGHTCRAAPNAAVASASGECSTALRVAIFVDVCLSAVGRAGLWTCVLKAEDVAVAAGCQQVPAVRGQPACAHRRSDLPGVMESMTGVSDAPWHDRSTAATCAVHGSFR